MRGDSMSKLPNQKFELLVNAVSSSKFITENKSKQLINKIGSLTISHEAKQLTGLICVAGI